MATRKKLRGLLSRSTISVERGNKAYRELRQEVIKAGILDRDYSFYLVHFIFAISGFAFSIYKVFTTVDLPFLILWSIILGFFSVQVAAYLHDAGHRAVFKSTFWNDMLGYLAVSPFGMGYSYWKIKHNAHHAHPNEEDEDPDLELPVLSFTKERYQSKKGLARFLRKYQTLLYYPMATLVFLSVRNMSLQHFIKNFKTSMIPEIFLFIIGNLIWFGVPFYFFDLPKAILVTILVNFTTGLYMFQIFAPNHKGMPHLKKGTKVSFLEQQVITSRNIYGNPLSDIFYMGLNYQIEHHLFPSCPRNKLKFIRPILMKLCKKLHMDYTEVGIIESNKIILAELHQIAKTTR